MPSRLLAFNETTRGLDGNRLRSRARVGLSIAHTWHRSCNTISSGASPSSSSKSAKYRLLPSAPVALTSASISAGLNPSGICDETTRGRSSASAG